MKRKCIIAIVFLLFTASPRAEDYSLPSPPPEFFTVLSKTHIIPGEYCCNEARKYLSDSVLIPASLAAKLFNAGKLLIADANTAKEYNRRHILGAISMPWSKVDFMKIRPMKVPIGIY